MTTIENKISGVSLTYNHFDLPDKTQFQVGHMVIKQIQLPRGTFFIRNWQIRL